MKFTVIKTSDGFQKWNNAEEIELNTLEELINWMEKQNHEVIIDKDQTLEIYDDYRE